MLKALSSNGAIGKYCGGGAQWKVCRSLEHTFERGWKTLVSFCLASWLMSAFSLLRVPAILYSHQTPKSMGLPNLALETPELCTEINLFSLYKVNCLQHFIIVTELNNPENMT